MSKLMSEKGIVTLCGTRGCCPTVDFTNPRKIILKDDFGGQVQLNRKQWRELKLQFASKAG